MKIKDIQSGTWIEGIDVYVKDNTGLSYTDKKTGQSKCVLKYEFADETGTIGFVDFTKDASEAKLEKNKVVSIRGQITDYQGKLQIKSLTVGSSDRKLCEFAKRSNFDLEKMWNDYVGFANKIKDPLIKNIAEELLLHEETLKIAPAARGVHNDWIGGLMEHSYGMAVMAEGLVEWYKQYYPEINLDKIIFGCLFHDLGKIWEYDYTSPSFEYTRKGHLVPHIIMVCCEIEKISTKIMHKEGGSIQKTIDELIHLISSHHGQLEWGSPVVPKTIEAVLLHQLDLMDARMMAPYNIMEKGEGEFTEKLWAAGTPFLRQKIK